MLRRAVEMLARATSKLLSDDSVFTLVQQGLSGTLEARRLFERNLVRILAGANIPSRQDLDQLLERVEALNRDADAIARRVEALNRGLSEDAEQRRRAQERRAL